MLDFEFFLGLFLRSTYCLGLRFDEYMKIFENVKQFLKMAYDYLLSICFKSNVLPENLAKLGHTQNLCFVGGLSDKLKDNCSELLATTRDIPEIALKSLNN